MLGRIGCVSPQVIMSSDGSWLGTLVCIERMTHRSSAWRARCGNSSLISIPLRPCLLNLNGDWSSAPVFRSVFRTPPGGICPLRFVNSGFGSKVSTCDGPPFMNRWMTRLARAGNCGPFGARALADLISAASKPESAMTPARPRTPIPVPTRCSMSRRVMEACSTDRLRDTARQAASGDRGRFNEYTTSRGVDRQGFSGTAANFIGGPRHRNSFAALPELEQVVEVRRERVARLAAAQDEAAVRPCTDVNGHAHAGDVVGLADRLQRSNGRLTDRIGVAAERDGAAAEDQLEGPCVAEQERPGAYRVQLTPGPARAARRGEFHAVSDDFGPRLGEPAGGLLAQDFDERAHALQEEHVDAQQPGGLAEEPLVALGRPGLGDLHHEAGGENREECRGLRVGG